MWDLVAGAVTNAHAAHAAPWQDAAGSMRTFLREAALLAVRALNGAGSPTLLPAMHQVMNTVPPGLFNLEAAPYGFLTEWQTSKQAVRHLLMGALLRLTDEGLARSLHSRALALMHGG